MKRIHLLSLTLLFLLILVLSGCFGGDEGPALFDDEGNEITVDETTKDVEDAEDGEFGYKIEGTQCVIQIHGGCVPYDYKIWESSKLGLTFNYPADWTAISTSSTEAIFVPGNSNVDEDPTRLIVWREAGVDETYMDMQWSPTDDGEGVIGDFDVTWEVSESEWEGAIVTVEWIWVTYDDNFPEANYIFFLMTEPENFETDRSAIQAAVSSILET